MEWLHCNQCFCKIQRDLKFYIKECGRIECQKCLKPAGEAKSDCKICQKPCKTILLSNDIKPEVQVFFRPIALLLDNVKKVYEFQYKNQQSILKHMSDKYMAAKHEVTKCYKTIDAYRKENYVLKKWIKENRPATPGRFSTSIMEASNPEMSRFCSSTPVTNNTCTHIPRSPTSISTIANSVTKFPYTRPGYPHRISPPDSNNFSPASSSEAAVVPGSRQSMVPTHTVTPRQNRTEQSQFMSRILQNSYLKMRPGR